MTKKRPGPIPTSERRILPVSAVAVQRGFETAFEDDRSFPRILRRFQQHTNIWEYLVSLQAVSLMAALMPEWDPTQRLAEANHLAVLGGAAIYMVCLKKEASLQHTVFPKIIMKDRTFAMARFMPEESSTAGRPDTVEAFAPSLVAKIAAQATDFDMVETDFCTMLLEYAAPEHDWTNEARHAMHTGASQLYHLLDAHYERIELEQMAR